MDAELYKRLRRLNVAVGRSRADVRKLPARVFQDARRRCIVQDFSGGQSEAELSETLNAVIYNIATLHDHLQNWGDRHGVSRDSIYNFLKESFDYCVVKDLCNGDKHGYPLRKDGWSKKGPRLSTIHAACQLKTRGEKNSSVAMTIGRNGQPVIYGDGTAEVIITGDVIDKNNGKLGDVENFIEKAIRHCEAALRRFGVVADPA